MGPQKKEKEIIALSIIISIHIDIKELFM